MDTTVAADPAPGTLDAYTDLIRRHVGEKIYLVDPATLGLIDGIVYDTELPADQKVTRIGHALKAGIRVRDDLDAHGFSRPPEGQQSAGARRVASHFQHARDAGEDELPPPPSVTVYFAFGWNQHDPDTGKHLIDHYVTVVGPSFGACRDEMFTNRYGGRYATEYPASNPGTAAVIAGWTEHERIVLSAPRRSAAQLADDVRAVS